MSVWENVSYMCTNIRISDEVRTTMRVCIRSSIPLTLEMVMVVLIVY